MVEFFDLVDLVLVDDRPVFDDFLEDGFDDDRIVLLDLDVLVLFDDVFDKLLILVERSEEYFGSEYSDASVFALTEFDPVGKDDKSSLNIIQKVQYHGMKDKYPCRKYIFKNCIILFLPYRVTPV